MQLNLMSLITKIREEMDMRIGLWEEISKIKKKEVKLEDYKIEYLIKNLKDVEKYEYYKIKLLTESEIKGTIEKYKKIEEHYDKIYMMITDPLYIIHKEDKNYDGIKRVLNEINEAKRYVDIEKEKEEIERKMEEYAIEGEREKICMLCYEEDEKYMIKLECNHQICYKCAGHLRRCPLKCLKKIDLSKCEIIKEKCEKIKEKTEKEKYEEISEEKEKNKEEKKYIKNMKRIYK